MSSDDAFLRFWNAGPVEKRWERLLLDWMNKCVAPTEDSRYLSGRTLQDIVNKYKTDFCQEDFDRAMLSTNDIEQFLNYKYPILRLGYYSEDKDLLRKHYIMHLTLLFHCCMNSESGIVDREICAHLQRDEQETILKFCEFLTEMEVTLNNVEYCSSRACEVVFHITNNKKPNAYGAELYPISSYATTKPSLTTISSNTTMTDGEQMKKKQNLKFKSSVTVLPSIVTDTSSYSKTSLEGNNASDNSNISSVNTSKTITNQKGNFKTIPESKIYNVGQCRDDKNTSKKTDSHARCKRGCKCNVCTSKRACGDRGSSLSCSKSDSPSVDPDEESSKFPFTLLNYFVIAGVTIILFALVVTLCLMPLRNKSHFKQLNDVDVVELLKNVERFDRSDKNMNIFGNAPIIASKCVDKWSISKLGINFSKFFTLIINYSESNLMKAFIRQKSNNKSYR